MAMVFLSKKTITLLLISGMIAAIILRYPFVEHERYQTDSYYIHLLSNSIVDDGRAPWTYHSLSYVGYYPFSYPSGIPFLLAESAMLSGLTIESSILAMNMVFAVLFFFVVFSLARQIIFKPQYSVLVAFLASTGSRFIDTSYWDASARAPLIVLAILSLMVLWRSSQFRDMRHLMVASAFGVGCLSMHHMAILLIFFAIAYVFAAIAVEYVHRWLSLRKRQVVVGFLIAILVFVVSLSFGLFAFFGDVAERTLGDADLFNIDPPLLALLLNMAASYVIQIGVVLLVAAAGLIPLLRQFPLTARSVFPVTVLIAFVPVLGYSLYVSMMLAPFVAIIAVQWIERTLISSRRKRFMVALVVLMLLASIIMPLWSISRWNGVTFISGDRVEVSNQVYSDAIYLRMDGDDRFALCNVNTLALQLGAIGDASFLGSGIGLSINGDVSSIDMKNNVSFGFYEFPSNLYKWFEYYEEPRVDLYTRMLMTGGLANPANVSLNEESLEYFSTHSRLIIAIDERWSSEYVTTYAAMPARFPAELAEGGLSAETVYSFGSGQFISYSYYKSELISVYLVQLPM